MYRRIYVFSNRTARSFAPAAIHVDASVFILATVDGADVCLRLKTRPFRSFQISHMTSKVTARTAFRCRGDVPFMLLFMQTVLICAPLNLYYATCMMRSPRERGYRGVHPRGFGMMNCWSDWKAPSTPRLEWQIKRLMRKETKLNRNQPNYYTWTKDKLKMGFIFICS
jgi:hypothetical protein